MCIFDKIPEIEKDAISSYITCFGPSEEDSTPYRDPASLQSILKEWDLSKRDLFKLLGNKLSVSKSYTYALSDNMIADRFWSARHRYSDELTPIHNFLSWAAHTRYDILLDGEPGFSTSITIPCTQDTTLASNAWPYDTKYTVQFPSGNVMKINKGMRVIRILAKFVDEFGNESIRNDFEEFRIWHSRILQNKYVDGVLTLSIHPLDFMTMSDNDNNWDSCMRWQNGGGDYRLGTVECMNSPYILIAYLHDPNHTMEWTEYNWGNKTVYEWNSKQWRELFIVKEELMTEIYPYPFQDSNITNAVLMWIKDLAAENLGWTYENEEVNMVKAYSNPKVCPEDIVFSFHTEAFMYQDLGRMDIHRGRININKVIAATQEQWESHKPLRRYFQASYGGQATCMWCGGEIGYGANEHNVFCQTCEPVIICACCGEVVSSNYVRYFDDDDTPYCEECFSDKAVEDSFTGEYINTDDANIIYWQLGQDENGDPVFYDAPIYLSCWSVSSHQYKTYFSCGPKYNPYHHINYVATEDFVDIEACLDLFLGWSGSSRPSLAQIRADYGVI